MDNVYTVVANEETRNHRRDDGPISLSGLESCLVLPLEPRSAMEKRREWSCRDHW
ncbi:hypothetical protein HanHA300_Chr08g0275621 [Helianthus annuus]|nr:hypothetical protein HanHA300_Chr08g0275621 [Helianthus annuus]KAJ0546388.1 hypothetical protein HanIR_Chr08g0360371 [Helianthus annuus]KAJ0553124.1 hypothetical protein HanHA89_Chr08g0292921 [Helianthus annuus]